MATEKVLEWEVLEHEHRPKSSDWTWIVGIAGVACAIIAVIFGNLLFGFFLIIATFTLILFAHKHPEVLHVEITTKGVRVNEEYFPYVKLDSYWVDDVTRAPSLILTSKEKSFLQHIKIPLHEDVDPDHLRDVMLDFLDEEYKEPSLVEEISYHLGF